MKNIVPYLWGLAVLAVALLNIADVLPDWTTFAAILTLPYVASRSGMIEADSARTLTMVMPILAVLSIGIVCRTCKEQQA